MMIFIYQSLASSTRRDHHIIIYLYSSSAHTECFYHERCHGTQVITSKNASRPPQSSMNAYYFQNNLATTNTFYFFLMPFHAARTHGPVMKDGTKAYGFRLSSFHSAWWILHALPAATRRYFILAIRRASPPFAFEATRQMLSARSRHFS